MAHTIDESKRAARDRFDGSGQTVHCYPLIGPEHDTDGDGSECWCAPDFEEYDNGNRLAIHRLVN